MANNVYIIVFIKMFDAAGQYFIQPSFPLKFYKEKFYIVVEAEHEAPAKPKC